MSDPNRRSTRLLSICLLLCVVTAGMWALSLRQVIRGGFDAAGARWQVAAVDGCILIVGTRIVAPNANVHETLVIDNAGSIGFVMPAAGRGAPPLDYYGRLPLWMVMLILVPLTAWLWLRAARGAAAARCPACEAALPQGAAVCPACGGACGPDAEHAAAEDDDVAGDPACGPGENGDDGPSRDETSGPPLLRLRVARSGRTGQAVM